MTDASTATEHTIKRELRQSKFPVFRSFKTVGLIHYLARWHYHLLIQLTLDPRVIWIKMSRPTITDSNFDLSVVLGTGEYELVFIENERDSRAPTSAERILVKRSDVLSEPAFSNAKAVWSTRSTPISAGDRLRVLSKLGAEPDGLAISDLVTCVACPDCDRFNVILALACLGLIDLDLRHPLAPETKVRRRVQTIPGSASAGSVPVEKFALMLHCWSIRQPER